MTVLLVALALIVPVISLGVIVPRVMQQELQKLDAFYPKLAHRGPMTADEIVAATRTMRPLRSYVVDAIEAAADAGRIERRPPFPGQRALRYTVRRLRSRTHH